MFDSIEAQSQELAELAESAAFDKASWKDFTLAISNALPGSTTNFLVLDKQALTPLQISTDGLISGMENDYVSHYGHINPWNRFWPRATVGKPYSTRAIFPSSLIDKSEFYNDWMIKTGRRECLGMILETSTREILRISTLMPLTGLERNEEDGLEIYRNISDRLIRAVEYSRMSAMNQADMIANAAIFERGPDIAFVTDHSLAVIAANDSAKQALLHPKHEAAIVNGSLQLQDLSAMSWLRDCATALLYNRSLAKNRKLIRLDGHLSQISISRIPSPGWLNNPTSTVINFLLLIIIRQIDSTAEEVDSDLLMEFFALTPAEAAICNELRRGLSLYEVADAKGITHETVRYHLKAIFRKTATNRQAELVAMLQKIG